MMIYGVRRWAQRSRSLSGEDVRRERRLLHGIRPDALVVLVLAAQLLACAEGVRISRGTRSPPELRGASSAQATERFTQHQPGPELSVVATFIDLSYVRAVTREQNRTVAREREAFDRYVRRRAVFYVYLVLHDMESCRGSVGDDADGSRAELLDLRAWHFRLITPDGRQRGSAEIEPGPTQLATSGSCQVQGYVHFERDIPRQASWFALEVASDEGGDDLSARLRWNVEPWTPPPLERERRARRGPPRAPPAHRSENTVDGGGSAADGEGAQGAADHQIEE